MSVKVHSVLKAQGGHLDWARSSEGHDSVSLQTFCPTETKDN